MTFGEIEGCENCPMANEDGTCKGAGTISMYEPPCVIYTEETEIEKVMEAFDL